MEETKTDVDASQDVSEESSPSEDTSAEQVDQVEESQDSEESQDDPDSIPESFADHPRWQEWKAQRDEAIEKAKEYESKIAELEKKTPEPPASEPSELNLSPQMQKIVDAIKGRTVEETIKELQSRMEAQQKQQEEVQKTAQKAINDLKKKLGSEEVFEKQFKPFYQKKAKEVEDLTGVIPSLDKVYALWKAEAGDTKGDKDKVSPGSMKGPDGKSGFQYKPGETVDDALDRYMEENT